MKSDVGLASTLLVLGAQPQVTLGTGTVLSDSGGRDQSPDYGSCYKQAITLIDFWGWLGAQLV